MDVNKTKNGLEQTMLAHRGEHQGRFRSWGPTRKGDIRGCDSMAIRTTCKTPVALGMHTPPMRDREFSCSHRNECGPFLTRVTRGVKRILCHLSGELMAQGHFSSYERL